VEEKIFLEVLDIARKRLTREVLEVWDLIWVLEVAQASDQEPHKKGLLVPTLKV
jgi:hypothetical protein